MTTQTEAPVILRGRITDEGQVELFDPIPTDFDRSQEVQIVLQKRPTRYETLNAYGDPVIVDEEDGTVTPLNPLTLPEFAEEVGGLWKDRKEEIGDSVEWVKAQRRKEEERRAAAIATKEELLNDPVIGIWKDREDLADSAAWVRELRQKNTTRKWDERDSSD